MDHHQERPAQDLRGMQDKDRGREQTIEKGEIVIKNWWKNLLNKRKVRNLDAAIKLCQSHGLACCEIANKAGTDYIKG